MKDAEKAIIENLRKTTLSHLSEYNYEIVIKEIEKYGITNLTGTAEKLVREAVNKHGSHNQSSHGRKGGGGSGGAGGMSSAELRELARLNFGNSGSKKGLKRGDTLDNIKNAEGVRVKISGGSALDGKKGRVVQSAPSGKFHGVKTDDGEEGYINGADLTVISLEKSIDINMEKHGSHNQSSHGRKGGGKGGGSAEAPKEFEDKLVEASEGLDNMIMGAQKLADNAKDRKSFDMARGAVRGFKDVKSALGNKKQMKAVRLKRNSKAAQIMKTPGSLAPLQEGYAENVGYVQGATSALAQYGDL